MMWELGSRVIRSLEAENDLGIGAVVIKGRCVHAESLRRQHMFRMQERA